jgi:hypothetical protein
VAIWPFKKKQARYVPTAAEVDAYLDELRRRHRAGELTRQRYDELRTQPPPPPGARVAAALRPAPAPASGPTPDRPPPVSPVSPVSPAPPSAPDSPPASPPASGAASTLLSTSPPAARRAPDSPPAAPPTPPPPAAARPDSTLDSPAAARTAAASADARCAVCGREQRLWDRILFLWHTCDSAGCRKGYCSSCYAALPRVQGSHIADRGCLAGHAISGDEPRSN